MAKTLILLSGGMDSVTALHWAAREHEVVGAVSFDYGAKHNHRELELAAWHCGQLGVRHDNVALPFVNDLFASDLLKSGGEIPDGHYEEESMKRTVVPFRNGIMLAIACGIAESRGAEAIAIAAHAGDHAIYPDCREPFMLGIATAMREGTYARIELLRPFIHLDKAAIAQLGHELGVDYAQTWSCYKGGVIHCGTCGTCVERREAFAKAGLIDPTEYLSTGPLPAPPDTDSAAVQPPSVEQNALE
jgi:7-cyano-7-deazaguanine synthase